VAEMSEQPISALADYAKLLATVKPNHPVILTENGQSQYALVSIKDFAAAQLLQELRVAEQGPFYDLDTVMKELTD
jgi:PHD/YefM family antitoxin component YafN of YafNO toxin-antitoxin module